MGRTNPTFRDVITRVEEEWQAFRRTLRRRDQSTFDRLFEYAREHADAAGNIRPSDQLAPMLFSISLEQESRLDDLEERVDELEDDLNDADH